MITVDEVDGVDDVGVVDNHSTFVDTIDLFRIEG